jgi:hypothetical protein
MLAGQSRLSSRTPEGIHKKRLARRELAAHVAILPACTIVMEACGGVVAYCSLDRQKSDTYKYVD